MHKTPKEVFIAHPIFGWTLRPNSQVKVSHRSQVIQNINASGNRTVTNANQNKTLPNLNIYGCSFTYGTSLSDSETYASIIQQSLPHYCVNNKGIGGHSTVQNYLRFRDDINAKSVDYAVFGIISDHRYRNIPHPYRMKQHQNPKWVTIGVDQIPHVSINRNGKSRITYTPTWQPCMNQNNFQTFLPNEHFIDLASLAIYRDILRLGEKHHIPIIFALLDQIDPIFNKLMLSEYSNTINVSTPLDDKHTFQPFDIHPNFIANKIFAEGILSQIKKQENVL